MYIYYYLLLFLIHQEGEPGIFVTMIIPQSIVHLDGQLLAGIPRHLFCSFLTLNPTLIFVCSNLFYFFGQELRLFGFLLSFFPFFLFAFFFPLLVFFFFFFFFLSFSSFFFFAFVAVSMMVIMWLCDSQHFCFFIFPASKHRSSCHELSLH